MTTRISNSLTRRFLSLATAGTLITGTSFAATVPSLVLGDVQAKVPGSSYSTLDPDMPVVAGSELRTGSDGEVTFDFSAGSRAVMQPDSELRLAGVRGQSTRDVPVGFTTTGSAIKSILTQNDARPVVSRSFLPEADLALRRGSLISVVENSRQRIDLPLGYVYGTAAGFVTTVESPTSVRVTVHDGFATMGLPDGSTISVKSGEYVRVTKIRRTPGFSVTGPSPVEGDELAQADMAQFEGFGGKKGLIEPVAEFIADPVAPVGEGVGTGLSAPFDLASTQQPTRNQRLSSPPNSANQLPPVICPAR